MYSVGNGDSNQTYYGDHHEIVDMDSLCCITETNIVLQVTYFYNKQTHRKSDQSYDYQRQKGQEAVLDKASQQVQTSH